MARASIPEPHKSRIRTLRQALKEKGLDAYLILSRKDQYWLTGFTGEDGGVLVTSRSIVLLTDGRFDETADREAPFARKMVRRNRGPETFADALRHAEVANCGFHPDDMSVRLFQALNKHAKGCKLVAESTALRAARQQKDADEVAVIRRAIEIAETAFKKTVRSIQIGQSEREIAARLTYEMMTLGATGASFPVIVAAGPHASLPHHSPTDRKLRSDEVLLIDWGARFEWYASDLTRMVSIGSIPPQIAEIHAIVLRAQQAAFEAVKPGVAGGDVDAAARKVIEDAGFGKRFSHGLGHGLGLDVHEGPGVRRESQDVLRPGTVFTIEPGIYLPGVGGVRIEDDVLVTDDGCEVLSQLERGITGSAGQRRNKRS